MLNKAKMLAVWAMVAAVSSAAMAGVDTASDIVNWTGTGSNEAVIILDWNNGQPDAAMAWGVRFDGTYSIDNALTAICGSDARLYGVNNPGWSFWTGMGYDADNADAQAVNIPGGAANPYVPVDGIVGYSAWNIAGATPIDADDYFGCSNGLDESWAAFVPNNTIYTGSGWDIIGTVGTSSTYTDIVFEEVKSGMGSMNLQNDSWVAIGFGTYTTGPAPDYAITYDHSPDAAAPLPAPAPEPATMTLLGIGAVAMLRRRK